jgi:hypothetical protein
MKSSLDRYATQSPEVIEDMITKLNIRNSSAEKLPLIRKPFQFNASYAKVILI